MSEPSDPGAAPVCPDCGASIQEAREGSSRGGIRGGVPTPEEINTTSIGPAEREAARYLHQRGPLACAGCGTSLYRLGGELFLHRGPSIFLPMHVAAARLRNHLRRLAITRVGPITGDCYFVPYYRFAGSGPDGDESFLLAAASTGDDRLERPFLPPADLKPFAEPQPGAAGPSGEGDTPLHVLPVTRTPAEAAARVEPLGWRCDEVLELIHYPYYLMHVEDCGRQEGAWVDGIEVKRIHHRLRLADPLPSGKETAAVLALPAVVAAAAGVMTPAGWLLSAVLSWLPAVGLIYAVPMRDWRG